jgi:DNA-binding NtrC family response regulator
MPSKLRVMIVDDEPYYLDWLIEFFEVHGYAVVIAENVTEACKATENEIFKMVIVDLNVPAGSEMKQAIMESDPIIQRFPGLFVAQYARDLGHWDDQVIIYSVHMGEAITERSKQLYCTYLPKGRPDVLKEAILAALKRGQRRAARQEANRAARGSSKAGEKSSKADAASATRRKGAQRSPKPRRLSSASKAS